MCLFLSSDHKFSTHFQNHKLCFNLNQFLSSSISWWYNHRLLHLWANYTGELVQKSYTIFCTGKYFAELTQRKTLPEAIQYLKLPKRNSDSRAVTDTVKSLDVVSKGGHSKSHKSQCIFSCQLRKELIILRAWWLVK